MIRDKPSMNVSVICTIDGASRAQQIKCEFGTRAEFRIAVAKATRLVEEAWFGREHE